MVMWERSFHAVITSYPADSGCVFFVRQVKVYSSCAELP